MPRVRLDDSPAPACPNALEQIAREPALIPGPRVRRLYLGGITLLRLRGLIQRGCLREIRTAKGRAGRILITRDSLFDFVKGSGS